MSLGICARMSFTTAERSMLRSTRAAMHLCRTPLLSMASCFRFRLSSTSMGMPVVDKARHICILKTGSKRVAYRSTTSLVWPASFSPAVNCSRTAWQK